MTVASHITVFILFRLLLPLCLFGATIVRFSGFSLTYGCLLLAAPLMPRPSGGSMRGHTGRYLIALLVLCSVMLVAQIVFQGYLLGVATDDEPYGSVLGNCTALESGLRQLGLQRMEPNDFGNIMRIIVPDVGMFIVSLVVFILCRKLCPPQNKNGVLLQRQMSQVRRKIYKHTTSVLNFMGEFLVAVFLAASGIASPSVLSAVYFLAFLAVATWWACYNRLGNKFGVIRILLLLYSAGHLILEYLYQFQFFQTVLDPDLLIARILGMNGLVLTDCYKPWLIEFNPNAKWYMYASPGIIILLYYTLACETRRWFEAPLEVQYETSARNPQFGEELDSSDDHQLTSYDEEDNTERHLVSLDETDSLAPTGYGGSGVVATDQGTTLSTVTAPPRSSSLLRNETGQRNTLVSIFVYMMKQSYVATLILMMAWSITYHSWLTFVYLLSACIIWITPKKRRLCLLFSPLIVCYAEALLTIQYVFGLNLTDGELNIESNSTKLQFKEIGLVKYDYPCLQLGVQILFTIAFWLTLRQYMRERYIKKQEFYMRGLKLDNVETGGSGTADGAQPVGTKSSKQRAEDLVDGYDGEFIKSLGRWIWHMCLKYWIFVCAIMFLVMAVQEAVVYRIVYMVLFLYFVLAFQLSYKWWRLSIYVFWWIVIIYSMVLLCLIYTYQFDQVEMFWKNTTGISETVLSSIGLKHYSTGTLFAQLLTPTSFLIVIILQVHYFQKPFNALSDVNMYVHTENRTDAVAYHDDTEEEAADADSPKYDADTPDSNEFPPPTTSLSCQDKAFNTLKEVYGIANKILERFSEVIWRLLEIHVFKFVTFTIMLVSLNQVCASNVLFVMFLMMGVPVYPLRPLMSHLCQVWSAVIILAKMIYQLDVLRENRVLSNCSSVINVPHNISWPSPFNDTINNADYIGLHKTNNLAYYLKDYIALTSLIAFEAIIKIHQEQWYKPQSHPKPLSGIVFPDIKREDADQNLIKCFQFLVNYTFYKFGIEICCIMSMVTMVVRLDGYSVIYGVFLGVMLLLPRRKLYYVWPFYIMILVIFLALQYLACLGVPPGLCWDYPWDYVTTLTTNLKTFLYLPDFQDPPEPYKLLTDFFQLLFVCLQMRVFYVENSEQADRFGGGANESTAQHHLLDARYVKPHDFLSVKESYLDYIKTGIFLYMYWGTLIVVFIAGTTRISLFCMGYLVGCFFFLWFGQELLVKPLKNLSRLWGILLGYNFFVILSKSCLQLVGCVYLLDLSKHLCWLVQLFSIVCLRAGNYRQINEIPKQGCNLDEDEAGLTWDAICFVFLVFQLRIYKSHYFKHVVTELEVQNKLSARGAELINTNLFRRVEQQRLKEEEILNNIKKKMDRIKMRQEKIHSNTLFDSDDHYVVIRSGDYCMFEEESDIEDSESQLDQLDSKKMMETTKDLDDDDKQAKVDPFAVINTVLKEGTKEALQVAEKQQSERRHSRHSHDSESDSDVASKRDSARFSLTDDSPSSPASTPLSPGTSKVPKSPSTDSASSDAGRSSLARPQSELESIQEVDPDKIEDSKKEESLHDPVEGVLVPSDGECKETEEKGKDGTGQKVTVYRKLIWAVICGFIDSLIIVLQDISREYRSVSRILDREKEAEKNRIREQEAQEDRDRDVDREGAGGDHGTSTAAVSIEIEANKESEADEEETGKEKDPIKRHKRTKTPTELALNIDVTEREDFEKSMEVLRESEKDFHSKMPRILQLTIALFEALMSRSELVCYFAMILNHMISSSLLSLVYPLSVFLWAMISVPRPTKTYWVTVITYTEAIIVVKYLFQFSFFPWNDGGVHDHPFWPPRIIGIEKKSNYAAFDLVLLFCLFIHRTVLKRHGLWKDAEDVEKDMAMAEIVASRPVTPMGTPSHLVQAAGIEGHENNSMEISVENKSYDTVDSDHHAHKKDKKKKKKSKKKNKKSTGSSILKLCFKPLMDFYKQMTNPIYNAVTDVYAPMFMCDFVAFFIIVFGYASFGPANSTGADTTVSAVIQDNKVPVPFLVMLLAQFVLIIIDRALFLRKNVFGKFLFQILLVIIIHVWMFFVLPAVTNRSFSDNIAAQLWYFIKCVYFGLSAYQIRSGYPTRILGNFLTKKYNYVNLFCFKGFLTIPFLLELRALMDWMWTDTTLAIGSWLQMEDIYANIFLLKCWRRAESAYPTPRGLKRKLVVKYLVGGLLLVLLIFIIWFPLLLFSLANTVYQPNPPSDCTLEIRLGGYQPLFRMSAQQRNLYPITEYDYYRILDAYKKDPYATAFLNSYGPQDIYVATITGESTSVWGISPPSKDELKATLLSNNTINMVTTISFGREPKTGVIAENVNEQYLVKLEKERDAKVRQQFADMINGSSTSGLAVIPSLFPRFIRVPASGTLLDVTVLGTSDATIIANNGTVNNQANVTFRLRHGPDYPSEEWWELQETTARNIMVPGSGRQVKNYITILSFNDRVAPSAFSFFTSQGIIGLYLSFILVIGKFIRLTTTGLAQNIMYTHLPYVDRVLKICRDLYLVREAGELRLEEELFAKLLFLYRSPETLIKVTKFPDKNDKVKVE